MDNYLARQINILEAGIGDYRRGTLGLNSLIQRIEGVSEVLGVPEWKDAVYPIVLSLEQVNAFVLTAKGSLTESDKMSVEKSLSELNALINSFMSSDK